MCKMYQNLLISKLFVAYKNNLHTVHIFHTDAPINFIKFVHSFLNRWRCAKHRLDENHDFKFPNEFISNLKIVNIC